MNQDPEQLYQQRLNRYVTANRNGMPDRVPIRPFAAEDHRAARWLYLPGGHPRLQQGLRGRHPVLQGL